MYLKWQQKTIADFSEKTITAAYADGFVFTRLGKGVLDQTRSLRVALSRFEPTSENRRVLKKTENIFLEVAPLPYQGYHWGIHKLGKDFYEQKFGAGIFSAQKIKELITDPNKSNFNTLFIFRENGTNLALGYCIAHVNTQIVHYSYPFYDVNTKIANLGIGMMTKVIAWAKEQNKKYVYLGSFQRPTDTYKLQFEGVEWFDGKEWQTNSEKLKNKISK